MRIDPLNLLLHAHDMIWSGMDESAAKLLSPELYEKWLKDNRNLEMAKSFRVPRINAWKTRKKMSEPTISTNSGNFTSADIKSLRTTLEAAGDDHRADIVVKWRGQDVHVPFGWYLVEYVEGMLAQRNHGGL